MGECEVVGGGQLVLLDDDEKNSVAARTHDQPKRARVASNNMVSVSNKAGSG